MEASAAEARVAAKTAAVGEPAAAERAAAQREAAERGDCGGAHLRRQGSGTSAHGGCLSRRRLSAASRPYKA